MSLTNVWLTALLCMSEMLNENESIQADALVWRYQISMFVTSACEKLLVWFHSSIIMPEGRLSGELVDKTGRRWSLPDFGGFMTMYFSCSSSLVSLSVISKKLLLSH